VGRLATEGPHLFFLCRQTVQDFLGADAWHGDVRKSLGSLPIMPTETLRYDKMIDVALRGVVKQAVIEAAETGLPGDHHFYLTFRTDYPGVVIPEYLKAQYPDEITIVLQYQFYGLEVVDEVIGVTLSFNNKHENLRILLAAITTFADPSVNFALQFQTTSDETEEDVEAEPEATVENEEPPKRGEVVALDAFRKK